MRKIAVKYNINERCYLDICLYMYRLYSKLVTLCTFKNWNTIFLQNSSFMYEELINFHKMYLQLMVYYNTRSIKILIAKKDPLKFSLFFNSYWCYKLSLDQQHLYKEITNIILIIINKSISFQPLQNLSNGKKIKK